MIDVTLSVILAGFYTANLWYKVEAQATVLQAIRIAKIEEQTTSLRNKSNPGGEIRDIKNFNLSRNIVSLLVFGQCFPFFTSRDQLGAQQKHLVQVEESF